MSEVLEQLARHRFDQVLSEIQGADTDTLYRIFKTPEALVEYLREFDLDVTYEPNRPLPPTATRISDGARPRFIFLVLSLAPFAEVYTVPEMRDWAAVAATGPALMPTVAMFRRFAKAGVPGAYAAALWNHTRNGNAILEAWRMALPLDYAIEAFRR